jgi:hypothetical protein
MKSPSHSIVIEILRSLGLPLCGLVSHLPRRLAMVCETPGAPVMYYPCTIASYEVEPLTWKRTWESLREQKLVVVCWDSSINGEHKEEERRLRHERMANNICSGEDEQVICPGYALKTCSTGFATTSFSSLYVHHMVSRQPRESRWVAH